MKVLVVDDEKKLTDMIVETLKGFKAFTSVLAAYDGADALRKIENQKFDLILLDIGLPKKGGLDVLSYIREEELAKKTTVIIISAGFTAEVLKEARMHTNYFLAKPFKIDELKMKIVQVLKDSKISAA